MHTFNRRLALLFVLLVLHQSHAALGPSVLYNRLYGTLITATGTIFGSSNTATYRVYPYANGTQGSSISVGKFSTFVSSGGVYTYASYLNGDGPCPNGAYRQLQMSITCGDSFSVSLMSEPVMCTYVIQLFMPEACGVDFTVGNEAASASLTRSMTRSMSPTRTVTSSHTSSQIATRTSTVSLTSTLSQSVSASQFTSPSMSPSATSSPSATQSLCGTRSQSSTPSASSSLTQGVTSSQSSSATQTLTPSVSPSQSTSVTQSASGTPSVTQSSSFTPTVTQSLTCTLTPSTTQSGSQSRTSSHTQSSSATATGSQTQTQSPSSTLTASQTQTLSQRRTSSQTRTSTPVGPVLFDSTMFSTAAIDATAITPLTSNDEVFAVGFAFLGNDVSCGPGSYSLTQLIVAASSFSGSAGVANAVVSVYIASALGPPQGPPIATRVVLSVPVPASPSFVILNLAGLILSVPATGSFYALVLTFDAPTNLYAATPRAVPVSGLAQVYSEWWSGDAGVSWTSQSTSGVSLLLHGTVVACAASASISQTPSGTPSLMRSPSWTQSRSTTGTASQSLSRTRSQAASRSSTRTRTQMGSRTRTSTRSSSATSSSSQSGSASHTGTPSQTPSESGTPSFSPSGSGTPSLTASLSTSASQSASPSQTPSSTGFPEQAVVGGFTDAGSINVSSARVISDVDSWAVSFQFPESDPSCGPGAYRITRVSLPLSVPAGVTSDPYFVFALCLLQPGTGAPAQAFQFAVVQATGLVSGAAPVIFNFSLPASFVVNTISAQAVALMFYAQTNVNWYTIAPSNETYAGFAVPLGDFFSVDQRATWSPAGDVGSVKISGTKLFCSPTPTGSATASRTGTLSRTPSLSPSRSRTTTPTPSQARTASPSQSRTRTPSVSPTMASALTQSETATVTLTRTLSQTASASRSPSSVGTGSMSGTATPSSPVSGSPSSTSTPSASVTSSNRATPSASGLMSTTSTYYYSSFFVSVTVSFSSSQSPSASASGTGSLESFVSLSPTSTSNTSPSMSSSATIMPPVSPSSSGSAQASIQPSTAGTSSENAQATQSSVQANTLSRTYSPSAAISGTPSATTTTTCTTTPPAASVTATANATAAHTVTMAVSSTADTSATPQLQVTRASPSPVSSGIPASATCTATRTATRKTVTTRSMSATGTANDATASPSQLPSADILACSEGSSNGCNASDAFASTGGNEGGATIGGFPSTSVFIAVMFASLLLLLLLIALLLYCFLCRKRRVKELANADLHAESSAQRYFAAPASSFDAPATSEDASLAVKATSAPLKPPGRLITSPLLTFGAASGIAAVPAQDTGTQAAHFGSGYPMSSTREANPQPRESATDASSVTSGQSLPQSHASGRVTAETEPLSGEGQTPSGAGAGDVSSTTLFTHRVPVPSVGAPSQSPLPSARSFKWGRGGAAAPVLIHARTWYLPGQQAEPPQWHPEDQRPSRGASLPSFSGPPGVSSRHLRGSSDTRNVSVLTSARPFSFIDRTDGSSLAAARAAASPGSMYTQRRYQATSLPPL